MTTTETGSDCIRCGRPLRGRATCVYCGGSSYASPAADAPSVPASVHREGSTVQPYVVSALVLGWMAWWFGHHAAVVSHGGSDQASAAGISTFCALCGPLVTAFHFLVTRRRTVEIAPFDGLRLSRGGTVRWSQIESVSWRRGALAPASSAAMGHRETASYASRRLSGWAVLVRAALYVFLPAVWYLTPLYARVVLHLSDGRRIALRDLQQTGTFVRAVRTQIVATN